MRHERRILLIEDDDAEAKRSRDTLTDNGYIVFTASSLAAARRALADGPSFDLVFVDQNLPDGEGLTVIPLLRKAGVAAPVVLVTGNSSETMGAAAFEAGCVDFAVKDLNYHLWLPNMADAFIIAQDNEREATDFRWGAHVLGVCTGRLQGSSVHAQPPEFWPNLAGALESATDLAIRGLRASEQSLLGSLPVVHLQLRSDRHLVVVVRGGIFSAAVLSRAPKAQDTTELFAEATAYARARTDSGNEPGKL